MAEDGKRANPAGRRRASTPPWTSPGWQDKSTSWKGGNSHTPQNFKTPMVMMMAIPLSLIGIVFGHWLLGAFFTATSFIGMIALAGVMVRNSVLLIDFIEIRLNEGIPLKQAIIEAGAVRTTPILLTTGAVVIGASIILFDPIFQ